MKNILKLVVGILFFISFASVADPKTVITYGRTLDGFLRVKVQNETTVGLACYIAIDGFKTKFHLPRKLTSRWITATDKKFNYNDVSVWCDYLELYPSYRKYRKG